MNPKATLTIDTTKTYQTIEVVGGAYTGFVAELINELPPSMQDCFYNSYFSPDVGMGYTGIRIPIGCSDFDLGRWTYSENAPNGSQPLNFTQLYDQDLLRNAQLKNLTKTTGNDQIQILAAAWFGPKWMTKPNEHPFGNVNSQHIKPDYYQAWADYHKIWLQLMYDDGIKNINAISTGNEPMLNTFLGADGQISWEPIDQGQWIINNFVPTLKNSEFSEIKIYGYDDTRLSFFDSLAGIEQVNETIVNFLGGVQVQAYYDHITSSEVLDVFHARYPDKSIWYTENSYGIPGASLYPGPRMGWWPRAEDLAKLILTDFLHFSMGFFDWNMILDHMGGPTWAGNNLDAPIILNENKTEMLKQPMFYIMAHFSKFIPPGSVRIEASLFSDGISNKSIISAAFLRKDNKISVFVYNSDPVYEIDIAINYIPTSPFYIKVKPKSLNTLVFRVRAPSLVDCFVRTNPLLQLTL